MDQDSRQTQLILDAIPAFVFLKDTSNQILRVNRAVLESLGLPREAVEQQPSSKVFPADAERFYADDLEVIRSGKPKTGYVEQAGERWVRTDKVPLRNTAGEIDQIIVVATDITEMMQAEEERNQALKLLKVTGRIAKVGGWELDPRTEIISWSEQVCRIHEVPVGYTPTLQDGISFYTPDSGKVIQGCVQLAIDTGKPWDVELQLNTAKHHTIWVRAIGQAEFVNGECVRLWGTLQDITEQKQRDQQLEELNQSLNLRAKEAEVARWKAEQAEADLAQVIPKLSESEERYRTLFEESPVMHANVDPTDATIKDCNQMLVARLGYQDKSDLIGVPIMTVYSEDCQNDVKNAFEDFVKSGEVKNASLSLRTRQGEKIPVILNVASVRDTGGEILYSSSTWSDVTALTQANRDLEEFAYVASHDLKAPLRAINHLATWLEEDLQEVLTPSTEQNLAQLKQRVGRMDRLLDDLLAYSRANSTNSTVVRTDLGDLLSAVAELHGVEVRFMICADLEVRDVRVARAPLETILRNLVGNAIKHHDKENVRIEIAMRQQGDRLLVTVSDDGPGISADLRERAFRMFHTLRPRDEVEGSGMGLALAKRLVENAGGNLLMEQVEPHGLRLNFTWPLGTAKT